MGYIFIALTIVLTVYGQLIAKQQVDAAGPIPSGLEQVFFFVRFIFRPLVISAFAAAFFASLCWMAALSRFDLSYAYPFMSLSFVAVAGCSALLFHERITAPKLLGLALICLGVIVAGRAESKKVRGGGDGIRDSVQQTVHQRKGVALHR